LAEVDDDRQAAGPPEAPPTDARRPLALVLVRNTVAHDARVLREADTLLAGGYAVLVAGVVSTDERARRVQIDGVQVIRLAPLGGRGSRPSWMRRATVATRSSSVPHTSGNPAARSAPQRSRAWLQRNVSTLAYYLQGIRLVWRTAPALVHANDYNTMWIGLAAKVLVHSRLIYDSHELWADRNGRREWRWWLLTCEALFVRFADATVTASPGYAAVIAHRYRVEPPIVVRNIPIAPQHRQDITGRRLNTDPIAVYVGGLMAGRGLEQSIRALALVPDLRLRLIGPGPESYLRALARCAQLAGVSNRVEMRLAVAPAAVLDSIADADFGLVLIEPVCRSYELTLPNKLFEYAAAGLPVLASDLPVIGPLVRESGIGEVVRVDDVTQIAAGMRRLAEPLISAQRRSRVRVFSQQATWQSERRLLEHVYRPSRRSRAPGVGPASARPRRVREDDPRAR